MRKNHLLALFVALVLIFPLACAHKKPALEVPQAVTPKEKAPAKEAAIPEQVVKAPEEGKVAKVEGEQLSEEELAKQKQMAKERSFKQEIRQFEGEDIYFDFDKYNIRPDAASVLEKKAQWLKVHPNVRVLIEGHCDEWGSEEYNLALGERRANSAKEFLVNLGVDPSQISIISYGEEKPAVVPPAYCKDVQKIMHSHGIKPNHEVPSVYLGPNITLCMVDACQKAWAKNRRCHFVVIQY